MDTNVVSANPADLDAQMRAVFAAENKKHENKNDLWQPPTPGVYRVRILPNGDPGSGAKFFSSYGLHWWEKGLIGNPEAIVFVSGYHTFGQTKDPLREAVEAAKYSQDPVLKALAAKVYGGGTYVLNLMICRPNEHVGDIVTARMSWSTLKDLETIRGMLPATFFTLEHSECLHFDFQKTKKGQYDTWTIKAVGREPPIDLRQLGVTHEMLPKLSMVINRKIGNALTADKFSGDLRNPVAGTSIPGVASIPAAAPMGVLPNPGIPTNFGGVVPTAAVPAVQPVMTPAQPAPAPVAAPSPAPIVAPVQAAPVAVPQPTQAFVAPVAPMTAPAPVTVAPPAPVAAPAAAAPAASSATMEQIQAMLQAGGVR